MSRTSVNESGIVINVVEESETINDVLTYISQNIDSWIGQQVLWDVSLMDFASLESNTIRSVISKAVTLSSKRSGLKTAVVVKSDLGFGMMRMLQILSEGELEVEISVFRNHKDALVWLS